MQAFKNVGVFITLSALSLSSAWATDAFVAKAKLDGFKAIPPVLTSTTSEVCLEFKTQESTAATGEVLAQVLAGFSDLIFPEALAQLAGNPGAKNKRPFEEGGATNNIRLYFGQPFANGLPIATLCDNTIRNLGCAGTSIGLGDFEFVFFDFSGFRLSDIQFQTQQVETGGFDMTVAGVTFVEDSEDFDSPDFVKGRLRLLDDRGLTLMKTLIKRGLIYVVENDGFEASRRSGGIIEYKPPKPGTVRNGEIRGTLRLAPKAAQCPPPPEPPPLPDE